MELEGHIRAVASSGLDPFMEKALDRSAGEVRAMITKAKRGDTAALAQDKVDEFEVDLVTGRWQAIMDASNKHHLYGVLVASMIDAVLHVNALCEDLEDPHEYHQQFKEFLCHVLEECPDARTRFVAELQHINPFLVHILL